MVDDWIIVGRFGRVHGIKGFISVNSFTEPRTNILNYQGWHAYINRAWQPVNLLNVDITDKHVLVRVEGFSERELAMTLTNCDIRVHKDQLPKLSPDEFYWHELLGLEVINKQGEHFGRVADILPTGSNDVLLVQKDGESKQHLIPYVQGQFIIEIDLKQQRIIVDWDIDF
ncbi:16S rRNA-processing protein RimM [Legionella beliardensis]|uniref:Ribosome maturation factor RimM n=1 Tax=Legionella beliardensis TaxID=91822 RepID=A0A378HY59_9GAMM|nr:16S rRNA-processing protein RimM [Legionella beliardensis]